MKFITRTLALLGAVVLGASCQTTYDAYGNPVQSVDPGTAAVAVGAAALIGHAIGDSDDKRRYRHHSRYDRRDHHYGHYRHARHYDRQRVRYYR